MYCNNCGQFIEQNQSRCPNCGVPFNNQSNNTVYYDNTDDTLDENNKNLPTILAIISLLSFILGIVTKNISFLALILFLVSFILSEIGIKQSKKNNSKSLKIINSILGTLSIIFFVLLLINVIGTISIGNQIKNTWGN